MNLALPIKETVAIKKNRLKILVACGGTAGHFLPAISFSEVLKERITNLDLRIAVTKRKVEKGVIFKDYNIYRLSLVPIYKSISLKNLIAIYKLFIGAIESLWILFEFNPDIIIGFGGYASFPLVFFAHFLGKKTIIHEQNVSLGISNRLLALFVNKIAISFPQTEELLKHRYKEKAVLTGNPVRQDLSRIDKEEALRFFGFKRGLFTILIMGGSQGAHKINMEFTKALWLIRERSLFQVIHLSGDGDYHYLNEQYRLLGVNASVFNFLKEMSYAYSAADLVISRAGASSISEIIYYSLPSIIIPYPYAGRHQNENAKVLQEKGACIIIEDKNFAAERINTLMSDLVRNPKQLEDIRINLGGLFRPEAARKLADLVLSLN